MLVCFEVNTLCTHTLHICTALINLTHVIAHVNVYRYLYCIIGVPCTSYNQPPVSTTTLTKASG